MSCFFAYSTGGGATRLAAALCLAATLSACQSTFGDGAPPFVDQASARPVTGFESYAERARQSYVAGDYGLAESLYRKAVEQRADDAESWLGLAACYDNLGRFDFADRAYKQSSRLLGGNDIRILNNLGYSYFLRGDDRKARAYFQHALQLYPGNEIAANNLDILQASVSQR